MTNENPFGETIYSYSRKQAFEDGVLVDLTCFDSIRQHWKYPFACTAAVWAILEEALHVPGQDVVGICHDLSTMAKLAIHQNQGSEQIHFHVAIAGRGRDLKLRIGPGDTAAPVLTLMLPYED
jgi:hypothetical protein